MQYIIEINLYYNSQTCPIQTTEAPFMAKLMFHIDNVAKKQKTKTKQTKRESK